MSNNDFARTELLNIVKRVKDLVKAERESQTDGVIMLRPRHKKTSPAGGRDTLEDLRKKVLKCRKCGLHKTRINVVFGEGNKNAKLVFVGEAPGSAEDKQGLPFVGRAGELLTKIIHSIGLKREDIYIGNILKCRPPYNRNPLPSEVKACKSYLIKQIELIKPEVICALGTFAAQTILGTSEPIGKLRGKFHLWKGIKVMPTFHPAYLLRNPSGKRPVWEDIKKIRDILHF